MTVIAFPARTPAPAPPRDRIGLSDAYDYIQLTLWLGITLAIPFATF